MRYFPFYEKAKDSKITGFVFFYGSFLLLLLVGISKSVFSQQTDCIHKKTEIANEIDTLPWDIIDLYKTPKIHPTDLCKRDGFKSFFYEGVEYKASRTRVFSYYKEPAGTPPPGGWPAVICVHGGGGTAFPDWVQTWVDHGYAAIAMDLEGHLPIGNFPNREWHEKGGPPRITTFGDIELADREQWFFHAVADVIRANSLLRSFPEINKNKIGIHGISWGGVITEAVIGIDQRISFAVSVYGCGYLYQTTCQEFKKYIDVMSKEQLENYKSKWDPSNYLPYCKIPTLFYIGTNDGAFPLNIWQKSAMLTNGVKVLCIPISNEHGHIWNQKEIFAFADTYVGKGKPLLQLDKVETANDTAFVKISECQNFLESCISSVQLNYTKDTCAWQQREWQSIPAKLESGKALSPVPPSTTACYFSAKDKQGLVFSSAYKEIY